jgi:hypothetical protein
MVCLATKVQYSQSLQDFRFWTYQKQERNERWYSLVTSHPLDQSVKEMAVATVLNVAPQSPAKLVAYYCHQKVLCEPCI